MYSGSTKYSPVEQEQRLRGFASEQANTKECGSADSARPSIETRIRQAFATADYSQRRAQAAQRAAEILAKYPEFGELLDLVTQF